MKRTVFTVAAALIAAGSFGQNFTIVRPADGAHVREKVHILFPKGSIPPGGYVGIFLNGTLLDAIVPDTTAKYSEYVLDTKGRGIKDTEPGKPDVLEAKLYVELNDQPRITKTSSVELYIGNKSNIQVPNSGIKLRYNFTQGSQMVYDLEQRVVESTISESENEKNGNGDGLIRMQALPEKGRTYATLTTTESNGVPKTYFNNMMASIYMKLNPTGNEIFGSIPLYYPLEGTSGQGSVENLYADFPLPTLPYKSVRPGDTWPSRFQEGKLNLGDLFNQESVVQHFPAVGKFVGVEWERGHPCAKIENSVSSSDLSDEDRKLVAKGADFGGTKVQAEETMWFGLDDHKMLKLERDISVETKTNNPAGLGLPGGGPSGAPGGPNGMPGGNSGGGGTRGDSNDSLTPPLDQTNRFGGKFGGRFGGRPGGGGVPPSGSGAPGGFGQNSPRSGPGAGSSAAQAQYIRVRFQQIFTLEL
jgi:hypothetical protein